MADKVLKIDAHVHSKGISMCSHVSYQEIVEEKKKLGYDGIILTKPVHQRPDRLMEKHPPMISFA